ncbi:MAG: hypothetical protein JWQ18_298, partial [Conexibacter sp.]|nr:hypothetical protein [Conexibacter sp.]
MRSALLAAAIGASLLALPSAADAASASPTTGRLLVTLKPDASAHAAALVHGAGGLAVPQLRLAAVEPRA